MFYKQTQPEELTRAQMDAARKAFRGKLLRLRYSPQFIVNNADELLAIAHSEYARAVAKGVEVEDPVAWTIHCAWRRTQNLLQAESIRPRSVSSEQIGELIDDGGTDLEEQALEVDRARKVREAVAKLDDDQRKVIALTFFEDMSVREAARHLGCSASSVQHRRETALRTLRRFLPVRSGDELAVDFGMACWLAVAAERSGFHLPAGFETVIDRAGHGASGLWGRVQDFARRLGVGGGGEAATAVASSGAGRAAGVCAAGLAAVCLAGAGTGIVGPGIGAISGGQQSPPAQQKQEQKPQVPRTRPKSAVVAPDPRATGTAAATDAATVESPVTSASPPPKSSNKTSAAHTEETKERVARTKTGVAHEEAAQVEEETSGIARAGAEAPATTPTVAGASDQGSSGSPTVVHTESASSSPASKAAAAEEFNFEK
ncbi:MAG: sigma-70 family RNA polymerase sigma factor [Actinobacteria bacterium]|nr:sigma-70 family RNA polymerase sigma factor [Actinomycetota bacterium]